MSGTGAEARQVDTPPCNEVMVWLSGVNDPVGAEDDRQSPHELEPQRVGSSVRRLEPLLAHDPVRLESTHPETEPVEAIRKRADVVDPRVVGELKINGFSSYIHPLDGEVIEVSQA